jgi:hypothetical protein
MSTNAMAYVNKESGKVNQNSGKRPKNDNLEEVTSNKTD